MTSVVGRVLKIALLIWMGVVIWAAISYAPPAEGFRVPALARIMFFHVPCSMIALLASLGSAIYAILYLKTGSFACDIRSYSLATIAVLYWVLTTVTGALFAEVQWGAYWNWDPKQSAIVILLLIYLAYFALRAAIPDERRQALVAAGYTLFAAVTTPFLTFVLPNSSPSLHPQGVVFTSNGMDTTYHVIFWASVLGFFGLSYWMFRVQSALEEIRARHRRSSLRRILADGGSPA